MAWYLRGKNDKNENRAGRACVRVRARGGGKNEGTPLISKYERLVFFQYERMSPPIVLPFSSFFLLLLTLVLPVFPRVVYM